MALLISPVVCLFLSLSSMACKSQVISYYLTTTYVVTYINYLRSIYIYMNSLIAQLVKNLPAVQETWFPSLGQEDPPEKEMATCSSILAWKILWTEEPGELQSMGS